MNLTIKKHICQCVFFTICALSYCYGYSLIFTDNTVLLKQTIAMIVGISLAIVATKSLDLIVKAKAKLFVNKLSLLVSIILIFINQLSILFIKNNVSTINAIVLMNLLIITLIAISYFFGIDLKKFSLNINIQMFFCVILIFICFFLPYTFISGTFDKIRYYSVYDKNLLRLLLNGLISLIYHAAYEEYLFRGLLISGLLYLNIEKWKINTIQATIFGLMHIYINQSYGISLKSAVFLTSIQISMGYIYGKIFFKTNSLMPVIILHTLIDTL
jgi:membrane protease YdiL (CAAX protease family)